MMRPCLLIAEQALRELNPAPAAVDAVPIPVTAPSQSASASAATEHSQTSQEKESSESPPLLGVHSQRALLKPVKSEPVATASALAAPAPPQSSQAPVVSGKRKQSSTDELPTGGDENGTGKKKREVGVSDLTWWVCEITYDSIHACLICQCVCLFVCLLSFSFSLLFFLSFFSLFFSLFLLLFLSL